MPALLFVPIEVFEEARIFFPPPLHYSSLFERLPDVTVLGTSSHFQQHQKKCYFLSMTLIFTEASLPDITKHVYFTVSVIVCYGPKVRNLP